MRSSECGACGHLLSFDDAGWEYCEYCRDPVVPLETMFFGELDETKYSKKIELLKQIKAKYDRKRTEVEQLA